MGTFFEALSDYKFSAPKENLIIRILEEYNCRVSEILQARWVNFYPDKYLILPGLKRSRSICVRDKAILSLISVLPRHDTEFIFKPISYHRIYTLCNRLLNDKVNKYKKRKNKKVTHFFRYENVAQLDNDKIIQDILHHNSARSSGYYKTKQKGYSNEK